MTTSTQTRTDAVCKPWCHYVNDAQEMGRKMRVLPDPVRTQAPKAAWTIPVADVDVPREFSLWCDPMELAECQSGCGLTLYFLFLRLLIILMTSYVCAGILLILGVYNSKCYFATTDAFLGRRRWSASPDQSCNNGEVEKWPAVWLCAPLFWLTLRTLALEVHTQKDIALTIDEKQCNPSDYALLVRNLPENATEEEIKAFFLNRGFERNGVQRLPKTIEKEGDTNIIVVQVMICRDLKKLRELERDYRKLEIKKVVEMITQNTIGLSEIQSKMKTIDDTLSSQEFVKNAKSRGIAIVILSKQHMRRALVSHWKGKASTLPKFKNNALLVTRAVDPTDMNWEHLDVPRSTRFWGRFLCWVLMVLAMMVCFVIAYFATLLQGGVLISVLVSIILLVNNFTLRHIAKFLAPLEKQPDQTSEDRSIMWRLSLCMVVNTCLINLVVLYDPDSWTGPGSLSTQVFTMCASNAMSPLSRLLDIWGWASTLHRWFFEYRNGSKHLTTDEVKQYEQFFVPTVFDEAYLYACAIKTFFLALIYAPLAPFSAPILCLIGLCVQYFADKFFVIRYSRRPTESSKPLMAKAAAQFVSGGVLLSGFFVGLFIGYSGRGGWKGIVVGIVVSFAFVILHFLPQHWKDAIFLISCFEPARKTRPPFSQREDYYKAQEMWEKELKLTYHKSYPLHKNLSE